MELQKQKNSGSPTVKPASGLPTAQTANTSGGLANKEMADAAYQKAIEESTKNLERLETEIASAPNTKLSVKESARDLGLSFREPIRAGKIIGMVRSPEAVTQRLRYVQRMQSKQ